MGTHNGIYDFTIGQRKGIGVGGISGTINHKPYYVLDIDTNNRLLIALKNNLQNSAILAPA